MWGELRKSTRELRCTESDCLSRQNHQVASEKLGEECFSCDACVEENKGYKCNCSIKDQKNISHGLDDRANSSFAHSVVNMIAMLLGLGQLSTPYVIENGGWASAFLLFGLGVTCTYTSYLLGKCLEKNPNLRSYTDIGHDAFGRKGKILAATFIYMEIFMALVSYTISLHDNIGMVFSGMQIRLPWLKLSTPQMLTMIAVLIILPSLWLRDLSAISFLSSGGILMSAVILTSVASTAIFGGVKTNHRIPVINFRKIPAITGLYIFGYTGHIVFPNLYKSMKDPSKFVKVSIVSFASVTALYAALGFLGANMFGSQVNSQITLSLPRHLIVTKIALWATVLAPMTKYALEFAPFAIHLEHSLPSSISSRTKMMIRSTVGSILLLLILALALSVPYFEHVLSLTGSLVSVSTCVIMPCVFYTRISWSKISRPILILNTTLVAFVAFLGAVGTVSSSKALVKSIVGH
ncbi:hypothetical protein K2173_019223 [Erythroxylum novogranatense]|uniref:Amino acid transporter transmembrane domain-containing protein n=1 Tax=Erythroxylum novogranatense TaxID=1862640 RepID=A0AAV8ST44_9ROSI|nr:hypothetical protein K2173_019223 [Erythroxylum novogranatense]